MHTLLLLVQEPSFSYVVCNNQRTVLAIEDHRVRSQLNIDRSLVFGLVLPRTGNEGLVGFCVIFDYSRSLCLNPYIIKSHRKKLVSRITIDSGSRIVDG